MLAKGVFLKRLGVSVKSRYKGQINSIIAIILEITHLNLRNLHLNSVHINFDTSPVEFLTCLDCSQKYYALNRVLWGFLITIICRQVIFDS